MRTRSLAVATLVTLTALVAVAAVVSGGEEEGPADRAASLVPAAALAYVHLASAPDGEQYLRAAAVIGRLPSLAALRDRALSSLSASGEGFDFGRDVRGWLGDEIALALVDRGLGRAGSLVLLRTADERVARQFLSRVAVRPTRSTHRGVTVQRFGRTAAAFADGFMLIGAPDVVRRALDVRAGAEPALGRSDRYRQLRAALPADRLLSVYGSARGAAALLPGPVARLTAAGGIRAFTASLTFEEGQARISVRARHGSATGCSAGRGSKNAEPPRGAAAALRSSVLDCIVGGLVAGLGSDPLSPLGRFAAQARRDGVDLARDMLPLLRGGGTVRLSPGEEAPTATALVDGVDPRRGGEVIGSLQPALVSLLRGASPARGQTPSFEAREAGRVVALTATIDPNRELSYAFFDERMAVSTAVEGITRAQDRGGDGEVAGPERRLPDLPGSPSTVIFIDLEQLLALAEQAGLAENPGFLAFGDDIQKLRSLGAAVSREGKQTTAELLLKTP